LDRARSTFQAYGVAEVRSGYFDTVFCFGFLYHTLNQYDLLRAITALEPSTLLLDSRVVPFDEPAIFLAFNDSRLEGGAIPRSLAEDTVLVGVPTVPALLTMACRDPGDAPLRDRRLGGHSRLLRRSPRRDHGRSRFLTVFVEKRAG